MSNTVGILSETPTANPFASTRVQPPVFWWGPYSHLVSIFVLSYYVSLRSEFRVVMSVTISASKRCSDRLYLQLFVGGFMSYLHYLCLFTYRDGKHILCCVFIHLVYHMLPFSLDCPFCIL